MISLIFHFPMPYSRITSLCFYLKNTGPYITISISKSHLEASSDIGNKQVVNSIIIINQIPILFPIFDGFLKFL